MGIKEGFSSYPNFSNAFEEQLMPTDENFLEVQQQCAICIDEKGANALGMAVSRMRGGAHKDSAIKFNVNRPFDFILIDSKRIIFMGRVKNFE